MATDRSAYNEVISAMEQAAAAIKASKPQTILILSRYQLTLNDAIGYSPQSRLRGAIPLSNGTTFTVGMETDSVFNGALLKHSERMGIPMTSILDSLPIISTDDYFLHHTATIPLHFLSDQGLGNKQIVRLTMGHLSYEELYTFGKVVQLAAQSSGRQVAVIGSANLLPNHWVNGEDKNLDTNINIMYALGDQQPRELQNIGYPPGEEYTLRTAAFVLGAVSGLKATVGTHYFSSVSGESYGLMQYNVPK
ncbi:MAG: hypothetical protein KH079_06455 [Veillonella seminalis]|uniref:hypothetical protein n=1 Tax=Veillonella seminalis TaxID=1502943 RepID=UPI0023EFB20E|nr:hypothetical protein [Veillonella seminalis]MBS7079310.1 hypothetical protein [Veillonella seminalis]